MTEHPNPIRYSLPIPMSVSTSNETSETNHADVARRATVLYGVAAFVSIAGLVDSIYLTVEHLSGRSVRCTIVSGCSEVLSSPYATVRGIPLAAIGALAYFIVFSLSTLAAFGYRGAGKLLTFIVGAMFLTTLWLLYLQAFVIGHFCQFCLLSALVTTTLMVLVIAASIRTGSGSDRPNSQL